MSLKPVPTLTIGPEPTLVFTAPRSIDLFDDAGAPQSVKIAITVVAGVSAVLTSSSTLLGGRAMQLLALASCRGPTLTAATLPWDESLLPMSLGGSELAGHLGAAVLTTIILVGVQVLHYVFGVVLGRAMNLRTTSDGLAAVRHPAVTAPLVLFFLPQVIENAMTVAVHGGAALRVQGIFVLLCWFLWSVYIAFAVVSDQLVRGCHWREAVESDPFVLRSVLQGQWFARPGMEYYLERFGYLFRDYRRGRTFLLPVELAFTFVCSAVAGARTVDAEACDALAYTYVAFALLHFVVVSWLAPFASAVLLFAAFAANLYLALTAIFLAMAIGGGVPWARFAAGWCLVGAVGLLGFKTVVDLVHAAARVAFASPTAPRYPAAVEARNRSQSPATKHQPLSASDARKSPSLRSPSPLDPALPRSRSFGVGIDDGDDRLPASTDQDWDQHQPLLTMPEWAHWTAEPLPFSNAFMDAYHFDQSEQRQLWQEHAQQNDPRATNRNGNFTSGFGSAGRFVNPLVL